MQPRTLTWRQILATVLTTLLTIAGAAGLVELVDSDGDARADSVTVTIPKAGQPAVDRDGTAEASSKVETEISATAAKAPARSQAGDHDQAKDETPAGAPLEELKQAQDQRDKIRATQPALPTAGASAGFPGCVTRFVGNQSSRNGVRPQQIWNHYTVSPNRPGWGDVWGIVAYFDRRSVGASSHFVIDAEGHCAYIVPIEAKSWTQAAANPIAISIEIINSGSEPRLMGPAGYAKLAQVHREIGRRTGIPMRRGIVRGCSSARSGIVQHLDGGTCAGGHHDITPYSIAEVVKLAASSSSGPVSYRRGQTKPERLITDRRCYHFKKRFARGASASTQATQLRYSRQWKAAAGRQKGRLDAAHRGGQPWAEDGIGRRRLLMAQTEAFTPAHRRLLCG